LTGDSYQTHACHRPRRSGTAQWAEAGSEPWTALTPWSPSRLGLLNVQLKLHRVTVIQFDGVLSRSLKPNLQTPQRNAKSWIGQALQRRGSTPSAAHPRAGHSHTHPHDSFRKEVSKSWNQLDTKGLSNFCVRNGQILRFSRLITPQSSQTAQTLCGQAHCVWGGLGARAHCSQELVFFKRALLVATSSFVWPASEWRSEGWWSGQTGGGEVLAAVGTRVECCHAATTEREKSSSPTSAAHSKLSISACIFPAPKHKCVEGL